MLTNFSLIKPLRTIISYRYSLWDGVLQDVKQQYSGSLLGAFWAFLLPLLQLGIYAILYTFIFKVRPNGLSEFSYTLMVFSGLVPLLAFGQAVVSATSSLTANKTLLMNAVFPAELIPLRAALAAQIPTLFGLLITVIFGFILGRTGWIALILAPLFWILMLMFSIGVGWVLSLLSIVVRDIQHSIGLVIMLMTMLSPFAYTPEMVPNSLKGLIYLNPMSYFVLPFQNIICYGIWPDLWIGIGAVILAFASFFGGLLFFERARNAFFDYV